MKDECINCGAWKGLHHYDTNQCPRNGQEASIGKTQEWESTVYQEEDNTADLRAEIARLTAGSEAMQETADRKSLIIFAKEQEIAELTRMFFAIGRQDGQTIRNLTEENRGLRQMLHMEPK